MEAHHWCAENLWCATHTLDFTVLSSRTVDISMLSSINFSLCKVADDTVGFLYHSNSIVSAILKTSSFSTTVYD